MIHESDSEQARAVEDLLRAWPASPAPELLVGFCRARTNHYARRRGLNDPDVRNEVDLAVRAELTEGLMKRRIRDREAFERELDRAANRRSMQAYRAVRRRRLRLPPPPATIDPLAEMAARERAAELVDLWRNALATLALEGSELAQRWHAVADADVPIPEDRPARRRMREILLRLCGLRRIASGNSIDAASYADLEDVLKRRKSGDRGFVRLVTALVELERRARLGDVET
ncbi:MAG: hypothetical protein GY711_34805 [bacterium]|nr:hypothetical protein [bacterium]